MWVTEWRWHAEEDKERKTEAEVDGQHQAWLDKEIIVWRSTMICCLEATPPQKAWKDTDDNEEEYRYVSYVQQPT